VIVGVVALVVGFALSIMANIGARRASARLPWAASVGAGAVASWLVASALFAAALMTGFDEVVDESMSVRVDPGGPAAAAGVLDGDRILAVDSLPVRDWYTLRTEVAKRGETPLVLQVQRGPQWLVIPVTPQNGLIHVRPPVRYEPVPAGRAVSAGLLLPPRLYAMTARGLLRAIASRPSDEVEGPVGIVRRADDQGPPAAATILGKAGFLAAYAWPFVAVFGLVMTIRARSRTNKAATP
jgi:membrane-associated protease RseP (regulator of RpoE activity)